eukprot:g326.t1
MVLRSGRDIEKVGSFQSALTQTPANENDVSLFLRVILVGLLLTLIAAKTTATLTLSNFDESRTSKGRVSWASDRRASRIAASYLSCVVVVVATLVWPAMTALMGDNPIRWLYHFIFPLSDVEKDATFTSLVASITSSLLVSSDRFVILGLWALSLIVALPALIMFGHDPSAEKSSHSGVFVPKLPQIIVRKLFHLLAVALFLPVIVIDPDLLHISYGVAAALLVVVECFRVLRVPIISKMFDRYILSFTDDRDRGAVVLSHFYLLLGCALPHWLTLTQCNNHESSHCRAAGVLAVGVGDAFAAVVGSSCGRLKWPGTSKTIEGTGAAVLSMVMVSALLLGGSLSVSVTVAVLATCLLETFTSQMDNLVLPLFFFALLSAS